MDFTKKPMRGYLLIEDVGMQSEEDFNYWIELAIAFNGRAKSSKKRK